MYLFNKFDNLLQKPSFVELKVKLIQHGIVWIDLDLLYSIRETDCQHFGCFIEFFVSVHRMRSVFRTVSDSDANINVNCLTSSG